MTVSEFQNALQLPEVPGLWQALFEEVQQDLPVLSDALLDEVRIGQILTEYGVLTAYRQELLDAARQIRQDSHLCMYLCLIEKTMRLGKIHEIAVKTIPGTHAASRFGLIFPLLMHIPENWEYLRRRGITEEMLRGTFYEFDRAIEVFAAKASGERRLPVSSFNWLQLIYENRLVRLGRLNFELRDFIGNVKAFRNGAGQIRLLAHGITIHRSGRPLGAALCLDDVGAVPAEVTETPDAYIGYPADALGLYSREPVTLLKKDWTLALSPGDPVIAVHIPTGGPLDPAECEAAYDMAKTVLPRCFPGFDFKVFSCISWLMDRQLKDISRPGAKIVSFLNRYLPYTRPAPGIGVFNFVFSLPPEIDVHSFDYAILPEDSSLRRSMKQHYLAGGRIYEDGGIFFD